MMMMMNMMKGGVDNDENTIITGDMEVSMMLKKMGTMDIVILST